MKVKNIEITSYWKSKISQEVIDQDSDTLVILLPGNKYTNFGPLLYYAYNISLQLGYDVLAIDYGFQKVSEELKAEEVKYVIAECKEIINKCLAAKPSYIKIIFIGKCTGTGIQAELIDAFSDYEQLNVFLTPMTRCIKAICKSRSLVIVGTRDGIFLENHINQIRNRDNVTLKLIKGANHDLETDDYRESIDILKIVSEEIHSFISAAPLNRVAGNARG